MGRLIINVEPFPSLLSTDIFPPQPSTYDLTKYNPKPEPSGLWPTVFSDRKNFVKRFF